LSGKLGQARLAHVAGEIADYKEQFSWDNSPQDLRRLEEIVRHLEPRLMLSLEPDRMRLSRKTQEDLNEALRSTLRFYFPVLRELSHS